MNVHDLEAFAAVVESGSISSASTRLNLTQPGVSRRVQSLEEVLGVELLDRHSKPLLPTLDGRKAYEMARRVLSSVAELRSSVARDAELSAELRIGMTAVLSHEALATAFKELRDAYPKVSVYVSNAWSVELLSQVETGRLDAAVVCLPSDSEPSRELTRESLGQHRVLLLSSLHSTLPRRPTLAQLSEFPWVVSQDACGLRRVLRRAFESVGLPFKLAVEAQSPEFRLSLIAQGVGLGMTSEPALMSGSMRGTVRVLDVADFSAQVQMWLVHRLPAGRVLDALMLLKQSLQEVCNRAGKDEPRQRKIARR